MKVGSGMKVIRHIIWPKGVKTIRLPKGHKNGGAEVNLDEFKRMQVSNLESQFPGAKIKTHVHTRMAKAGLQVFTKIFEDRPKKREIKITA